MTESKRLAWLCVIVCWTICTMGCATGRDFDMSLANQIVKGKTTKADVIELFGDPYDSKVSPDGIETIRYYHKQRTVQDNSTKVQQGGTTTVTPHFMMTGMAKQLSISFRNGVVTNVVSSNNEGW